MESLLNPPNALMLMESTRAVGYSLEAAVADIIDNSIAASANSVEIFFGVEPESYFAILDDGRGMDESELFNGMKYGSKNPSDRREQKDLGRFGLGLKTASLSQCRVLTVVSKKHNKIVGYRWDLNYIRENNDWYLLKLDEKEIKKVAMQSNLLKNESGTLVIWTDLDKLMASEKNISLAFTEKIPRVREHLSLVFHRYISGYKGVQKLKIKINEAMIEPTDPFLEQKSQQIMDIENIKIKGSVVKISPYILPHQSKLTSDDIKKLGITKDLRSTQGFYIYRNNRLLVYGSWFRLVKTDDLSKLARVKVDIPNTLDKEWTLDIKKSVAVPPDAIKMNLRRIVDRIAQTSRRVYQTRGKMEMDSTKVHPWVRMKNREGYIAYDININYPLVELIANNLDDKTKTIFNEYLSIIEESLPINLIRLDLNSETILASEQDTESYQFEELIRSVFENSKDMNESKLQLEKTEPFSDHQEMIDKIFKEMKQ